MRVLIVAKTSKGLKTAKKWPQKNDAPPTRTAVLLCRGSDNTRQQKEEKQGAAHKRPRFASRQITGAAF